MPEFVYVVQADYYGEADFGGSELIESKVLGVFRYFNDAEELANCSCVVDTNGYDSVDAYVLNMKVV